MKKLSVQAYRWGAAIALMTSLACSQADDPSKGRAQGAATSQESSKKATPKPSPMMKALVGAKKSEEDFKAAIALLQTADANADVEYALDVGDHRILAVNSFTLVIPGYSGDRRGLPDGVSVATVAGTSATPGDKHQQRFQFLARRYAEDYNTLLLKGLKVAS